MSLVPGVGIVTGLHSTVEEKEALQDRLGADMSACAVHLAGNDSRYHHSAIITLDGGMTAELVGN